MGKFSMQRPPPPIPPLGVVGRMQRGGARGTNPASVFACTPVGHGHVLIMSRAENTRKMKLSVCVCLHVHCTEEMFFGQN